MKNDKDNEDEPRLFESPEHPLTPNAAPLRRRRPAGAGTDPQVVFGLPQELINQIDRWAARTGRTHAGALRELVVRGLEQFERVETEVQFERYRTHAPESMRQRRLRLRGGG